MLSKMYKIYYKHVLTNILVGKHIEDYATKRGAINKFSVVPISVDKDGKRVYNMKEEMGQIENTCFVIVKGGIIVKVLDIILVDV